MNFASYIRDSIYLFTIHQFFRVYEHRSRSVICLPNGTLNALACLVAAQGIFLRWSVTFPRLIPLHCAIASRA